MSKVLTAEKVRELARAIYGDAATPAVSLPDAIRVLDRKAGRPTIGLVSPVYWSLAGERTPLLAKTPKGRISELAKRRASGVRFEVLAASYGAAVGRKVSVSETKDALRASGKPTADPETSYSGRGTRKSAAGEAARTVRSA